MAGSAVKKERPAFNPDVLRWAREWRGRSVDEVARKLKQPVQKIREWEDRESSARPTVGQARSLADFYERPFLEFFRQSLPPVKEPDLVPDFRRPRDAKKLNAEKERDLKSILSWAEAQRENALDLYNEIGEEPPELPEEIFASEKRDADQAAEREKPYGSIFQSRHRLRQANNIFFQTFFVKNSRPLVF